MAADLSTSTASPELGEGIRHLFPVLEKKVYLNACSQGPLSVRVREAYGEYLDGMDEHGSRWESWIERQDIVRGLTAELLSADPGSVAITASESAGMSALASGLDYTTGRDTVVTTDLEFPTAGQIWHAQERRGARIVHVAADPDHTVPIERFAEAIDDRTALVSITQVCFRNGARVDVDAVVELAHERGVPVHVDAYQGIGALPYDVGVSRADYVSGGFLKYLLGSPGAAFFYANPETTAGLVPVQTGWMAARDIWTMDIWDYDPAADARRFEAGTPPIPSLYAAAAGLRLALAFGVERTRDHVEGLLAQLRSGITDLGGTVVTPERSHGPMLAVAVHDEHAAVASFAEADVVVSSRDSNVRIAPHAYNTAEDIEGFLRALADRRHLLR